MSRVTNAAGTNNTFLLAHKILQPQNYQGTSGKDRGYWDTTQAQTGYDHMRWCDTYAGGTNAHKGYYPDDNGVDENHYGSSHPMGAPVLYADGSVKNFSYGISDPNLSEDATWQAMWAFDRNFTVNIP